MKRTAKNILSFLMLALLFGGGLFFATATGVDAQAGDFGVAEFEEETDLGSDDIRVTVARIVRAILGILGVITVLIILYGGFVWMTAGGNDEKVVTARKILVNAVIGLVIIFSSYAIASFVLNRLAAATGFQTSIPLDCADPEYASSHIRECGGGEGPGPGGGFDCDTFPTLCLGDTFFVKSITPRTESAVLNNFRIRVLLSQGIESAEGALTIERDEIDVTSDFVVALLGADNSIIEAVPVGDGFAPQGDYTVTVHDALESTTGLSLEAVTIDGEQYPLEATFTVVVDGAADREAPTLESLTIDGVAEDDMLLETGRVYAVESSALDNAGAGYVRMSVRQHGETGRARQYEGPAIWRGSDTSFEDLYTFAFPLFFSEITDVPARYEIALTGFDIDSNSTEQTRDVVVVGEHCDAFGAPTAPAFADECLAAPGDSCSEDWECLSGICDEEAGVCLSYPTITYVDPWDGGAGNWITIGGYAFGEEAGTVEFAYDANDNGVIDEAEWIPVAEPTQCEDIDTWTDRWVIVEVPDDETIPAFTQNAIRITRADDPTFQDTTINERGPEPGEGDFVGYFEKNKTSRPGLCRVAVVGSHSEIPGATAAPPETELLAVGQGFGTVAGDVLFGADVIAPISSWTGEQIGTAVPRGLTAGTVSVRVRDTEGLLSNGVPFEVISVIGNTLPIIQSIDPEETPRESFVTLQGERFGMLQGEIWMAEGSETAVGCANRTVDSSLCISLDASRFPQCVNTWSDTQVIAYIPDGIVPGTYNIALRTGDHGWVSNGADTLIVTDAPAGPSICSLTPSSGSAPLAAGRELLLEGINFTNGAPAFDEIFFDGLGEFALDSWNIRRDPDPTGDATIEIRSDDSDNPGPYLYYTGIDSAHRLEFRPEARFGEGMHQLSWEQSIGTFFSITVQVIADDGTLQSLFYQATRDAGAPAAVFALGDEASSGSWVTIERDIQADLDIAAPGKTFARYRSIEFAVSGDAKIDTIRARGEGEDGTAPATAYFWTRGADPANPAGTWLTSRSSDDAGTLISALTNTKLSTPIPEVGGVSMDTGPIRVWSNGQYSNAVTYIVGDCREGAPAPADGYHCCTDGEDAGLWKSDGVACEGDIREAGYVWRFTTGNISSAPFVVESCDAEIWYDDIPTDHPSPVPSTLWTSGDNACINANVAVQFSTTMVSDPADERAVTNPANVSMYTCTEFDGELTCDTPVEGLDLTYGSEVLTIWDGAPELAANTWYRVVFGDAITSRNSFDRDGTTEYEYVPLKPSRPCGDGTAYCFEFKTSDVGERCVLASASIYPNEHTTYALGQITNRFDALMYFYIFGRANQACVVLNVDGLGWSWGGQFPLVVDATVEPLLGVYDDSRGSAYAYQNTAPGSADITASVSFRTSTSGVETAIELSATSSITVDLGDPQVIDFWQNCTAACVNSEVGAVFNRQMVTSTYAAGFAFYECTDGEPCERSSRRAETTMVVDTSRSDSRRIVGNLLGDNLLKPNTWYVVELESAIRSVGGFDADGNILLGAPLTSAEWKFKTKNDDSPCAIDHVDINPLSFIERVVGNKKIYTVNAYGLPGTCNATGQLINPWTFDWTWASSDEAVATITNFESVGNIAPFCGLDCTLSGSDIAQQEDPTAVVPLCGNGTVDAGEDCDIALDGHEICSTSCLLISGGAFCGNGVLGEREGADGGFVDAGYEQCELVAGDPSRAYYLDPSDPDTAIIASSAYCNADTCLVTGSSPVATGDVEAPICGSGDVTLGETCDTADPDTRVGCSAQCLHEGTPLSQAYCDDLATSGNPVPPQCAGATSLCGNGIIESGEECEFGGPDGVASEYCSPRCLLEGDVCDTGFEQCDAGNPGCTDGCLYAGSSSLYDNPSMCGDGRLGRGEDPVCDLPAPAGASSKGQPLQIATALGLGETVDEVTQSQQTTISATTERFSETALGTEEFGEATYYLQCGYQEYQEPREGRFNSCAHSEHGVGDNSCCYPRPTRVQTYPADGAGISVDSFGDRPTAPVCRNTYIEAIFDRELDTDFDTLLMEETLRDNVLLAEYHDERDYDCALEGKVDVTHEGEAAILAMVPKEITPQERPGVFKRAWRSIKGLFAHVFGKKSAHADHSFYTLCSGGVSANATIVPAERINEDTGLPVVQSKLIVELETLLESDTTYAVILRGGVDGIADSFGVGIAHPTAAYRNDGWLFRTGEDICKLSSVSVSPDTQIYTAPFFTHEFIATGQTESGALITELDGIYDWTWTWAPASNPLFDIPSLGTPSTTAEIAIDSRDLEGELSVFAVAQVMTDLDTSSEDHTGRSFSGRANLYAQFCNNIWPARSGDRWQAFEESTYNFRFSYCADDGVPGELADDLPFLRVLEVDPGVISVRRPRPLDDDIVDGSDDGDDPVVSLGVCDYSNTIKLQAGDVPGFTYDVGPDTCSVDTDCVRPLSDFGVAPMCRETIRRCSGATDRPSAYCETESDCYDGAPPADGEPQCEVAVKQECLLYPRTVGKAPSCTGEEECEALIAGVCEGGSGVAGPLDTLPPPTEPDPEPEDDIITIPRSFPGDVLTRYLLFSDINDDVIGIQVFKNPDRDTLSDWYDERFGNRAIMRPITIDGYEGLTDGVNYYIHALNESDVDGVRNLYNNVYLFSINLGAQGNTEAVFQQIIESLQFNINIGDDGYCLAEGSALSDDEPIITETVCQTDFQCRTAAGQALEGHSGVCANARTKLLRDWRRVHDIRDFQKQVNTYEAENGETPALTSGTYYPGYTNSRWPSWQVTLGNALGASILSDEINQWSACGPDGTDQQTCWNAEEGLYHCPVFQQIYEYAADSTGRYTLYGPIEYFDNTLLNGGGIPVLNEFVDTASFSQDRWCTTTSTSPFGSGCGDGIIQTHLGEVCELGDTRTGVSCDIDGDPGVKSQVCAASCLGWEDTSACIAGSTCGNGVVEGDERCDDGVLNGSYGQCNASCSGAEVAYCGNGILDIRDGRPLEYCDANESLGNICEYITDDGTRIRPQVHILLDRSQSMARCSDGSSGAVVDGLPWCEGDVNSSKSKWMIAKNGIDELIDALSGSIDIGISLFSATDLASDGCSLHLDTPDLSGIDPSGGTPTASAITDIIEDREALFSGDPLAPRMVVLITDGNPGDITGCTGNSVSGTELAIGNLNAVGIPTHVIGFGDLSDTFRAHLDAFAEAGGTNNISNESQNFYDAGNTEELIAAFERILACSPYSQFARASCAYDCQDRGGYCGDGVVDSAFGEQCDDGNTDPSDGCSNSCTLIEATPVSTPSETPVPGGFCGDGALNTGEDCDNGEANGNALNPDDLSYGTSGTYCSAACDIITVEASAHCGNGIRDFDDANGNGTPDDGEWLEACDRVGDLVTIAADGSPSDWGSNPFEHGGYECINSCQSRVDGRAQCTPHDVSFVSDEILPRAIPEIAVINPMIGNNYAGAGGWTGQTVPYMRFPNFAGGELLYSAANTLNSTHGPQNLFALENGRLPTNALCTNDYYIEFRHQEIAGTSAIESNGGSLFPYQVNGEGGRVFNEYVLSPALPRGSFRIVARWTGAEDARNVKFGVNAYTNGFVSDDATDEARENKIVSYLAARSLGEDHVCDEMRVDRTIGGHFSGHWVPFNCIDTDEAARTIFYVHPFGEKQDTFIHSQTIHVFDFPVEMESIAVFIEALTPDNGDRFMPEFRNSDLVLEVYGDFEESFDPILGYNAQYTLREPDYVFRIKDVPAETSSNPRARYWHVLNLTPQDTPISDNQQYAIEPVMTLETDFCSLRRNIPDDYCERDASEDDILDRI